jgi:hypothetical protein
MKKILFLSSFKFTKFDHFKWELSHFQKKINYRVYVHDLSKILVSSKFNKAWKSSSLKNSKKFTNLYSWFLEFKKLDKRNLIIYNLIGVKNLKSFLIQLILYFYKVNIINYNVKEVEYFTPKKNLTFFINKLKNNLFNFKAIFFYLNYFIFEKLNTLFFSKKNFSLQSSFKKNHKNIITIHSQDFSNFLSFNNNTNNNNTKKKKYILYIDNGGPFYSGDADLVGTILPKNNTKKFYKHLNLFFNKVEYLFKKKIIIIPHSKYKDPKLKNKNHIPFFNNRITMNNYDALPKLINKSLFVISRGSTAISFAVAKRIPIQIIYSSDYNYLENEIKDLNKQSKVLKTKLIDILNFSKKKMIQNLKINKRCYEIYKKKFLTNSLIKKQNYAIIDDFFFNN